jgi:hypothetical protein
MIHRLIDIVRLRLGLRADCSALGRDAHCQAGSYQGSAFRPAA